MNGFVKEYYVDKGIPIPLVLQIYFPTSGEYVNPLRQSEDQVMDTKLNNEAFRYFVEQVIRILDQTIPLHSRLPGA
jgi:hypothetical protein